MIPAVEVIDVRYTYPDGMEALKGVTFAMGDGERVAVLGPNGAGKTTLAHQMNGIRRPDSGTIRIGEVDLDDTTVHQIRRQVGLVFQNPDDQLFMPRVKEDVGFGPANLGIAGEELATTVSRALAMVGAAELGERAPHHLSGGERRRVALATVLAMNPRVLVLDEPTSGLDPAGRRELIGVLQSLPMAQLVITHDLLFALELCPRALVMEDGAVVADDATDEILGNEALLKRHRLEMPYPIR